MRAQSHYPPIVMMTDGYGRGGTEQHMYELSRELVKRGLTVAAILSPRDDLQWLQESLTRADVRVHLVAEGGASPADRLRRLGALVQMLRLYPGCILHLQFTKQFGGELAAIAARLAGARAVVRTEHNPPQLPIRARDRLHIQVRDRVFSRVIFVSEPNRRDHLTMLGRDPRRCGVVNNGIDLGRFAPSVSGDGVRAEFGLDELAPIVGIVARFEGPRKGLIYFLEMAAQVARQRPEVRFLIVGDGPYRAELERQIATLHVGDRVVLTGSRQDVPRLLAAMQVFVVPSLSEGCQYTLLEAMAMGRPIVATPAGVAPEVVLDGLTGYLVPFADSPALAEAVSGLLADPALAERMGQRGRQLIVERLSLDVMVDNVVGIYSEVA